MRGVHEQRCFGKDRQPTTPVIGAPSGARVSWTDPPWRLQSRSWTSHSRSVSYGQVRGLIYSHIDFSMRCSEVSEWLN